MPDTTLSPTAATTGPAAPTPLGVGYLQSVLSWHLAAGATLLAVQRQQWEALAAWQRAGRAVQLELTDQWICRFGGGVPLDG
jgi:hypothetical protein